VYRHDGIPSIVLASKNLLRFDGLDLCRERVESLRELGCDVFTLRRPIHQDAKVIDSTTERRDEIDVLLETAPALKQLLRLGGIFPEIRIADARLYRREFIGWAGRFKDSSADPRSA
jgi:hypothetical protein